LSETETISAGEQLVKDCVICSLNQQTSRIVYNFV